MIAEAYILFLAFQDKLLSEGHYYVFLKEEQRRPSKCFTTLSWGGGTGNSLFQGFPRAFLGLEQAGSPQGDSLTLSPWGFGKVGDGAHMGFARVMTSHKLHLHTCRDLQICAFYPF